jgi:hypothetical protein
MDEHYQAVISNSISNVSDYWVDVAREALRPFNQLKPKVFPDGNQWCALYGDNLQDGVCAFGDTPNKAAIAFDIAWLNETCGQKS